MGYRFDDRVTFSKGTEGVSFLHSVKTGSGADLACVIPSVRYFHGYKPVGT
jgi:hypothetical protein